MPGTFFSIDIGNSGLAAAQIGIDVTGNNIANANTPGYSTETPLFEAGAYTTPASRDTLVSVPLGSGVVVSKVVRAQDQFLNTQALNAASADSLQNAQSNALTQVDNAFGEPSDTGLNAALGTFFNSFQDLANNPEDLGVRTTTVQQGVSLANSFQQIQSNLQATTQSLSSQAKVDVQTLNSDASQIATLNVQIRQQSAGGQTANSLQDQRDSLVNQVAAIANINVTNNSDGTVNIAIGATNLILGTTVNTVTQSGLVATGDLQSGDLAGITQSQTLVSGYQTQLNTLAASVVSQVNAAQSTGVGLNGTTTGVNFFTATAGNEANTIAVNPTLLAHPEDVAAAAAPTPPATVGSAGDGSNATLISNLLTKTVTTPNDPLQNTSIQNYYQQTVADAGGRAATAKTAAAGADANLSQINNQLSAVTGVVTDTEMVNLMKYQRAYQASARFIQTADDMLNTLITGVLSAS